MPRGVYTRKVLPSNNSVKVINEPELLDQIQAQQETIKNLEKAVEVLRRDLTSSEAENKELKEQNHFLHRDIVITEEMSQKLKLSISDFQLKLINFVCSHFLKGE
jgi:hypothetical protein